MRNNLIYAKMVKVPRFEIDKFIHMLVYVK
jgi:hypothetical protein